MGRKESITLQTIVNNDKAGFLDEIKKQWDRNKVKAKLEKAENSGFTDESKEQILSLLTTLLK